MAGTRGTLMFLLLVLMAVRANDDYRTPSVRVPHRESLETVHSILLTHANS